MAESTNRRINIWINDQQVVNSYKGISNALRKTRNELANMAMGTKEYYNKVRDLKKLQGLLDQHNAAQGRIATGWRKIRNEIKQIAVGNILANGVTMLATKVGEAFQFITRSVGEAEQGLTNVLTLMNDADQAKYVNYLKAGQKEVMELGFAQADTNKALFDAISSGVEVGKSIEFLKSAAVLAKGGVTQLGVAVDGMTSIQNAYNLSVAESANVADAFFTAQKFGKTTVEELAGSIGKVAPIASALGVSYQELLSASAQLTLAGISTHESMTYLKAAMGNLMKPAAESTEMMKKWNIPMGLSQVRTVGFTETLKRLNEVVKKSPDDLAKIIPSIEGQNAVLSLTNKGFESYQKILNDVMKDVGANSSLQKAFNMQMETLPNLMAKAKGELTSMAISVGEKLAPVIKAIIPLISGLGRGIIKLIDFITDNIKVIKLIAVASLSYVAALKLKSMWIKTSTTLTNAYRSASLLMALAQAKLTGNTTRAAAAQKMLNLSMKANPIGLIIAGITTIVAAYSLYSKKVDEAGRKQKMLNDLNIEARKQISEEKNEIEMLLRFAKDDTKSKADRLKAITRLNEISPEYLGTITLETVNTDAATTAVNTYIKALEDKTRAQIANAKMAEIDAKIFEYETKQLERINEIRKMFPEGDMTDIQKKKLSENIKNVQDYYQVKIDEQKKYRDEYLQILDEMDVSIVDVGNGGNNDFKPKNTPDGSSSKDLWDKYIEKYRQFKDEIDKLNKEYSLEGVTAWEKEFIAAKENYDGMMEVTQAAIDDLEAKGKTKKGLNDREAELLKNFYDQQISGTESYEKQIQLIIEKYSRSREDVLLDEKQKEINQVKQKYDELIQAAETFGIDYADLREKMLAELAAIDEKYKNEISNAKGSEDTVKKFGIFGETPDFESDLEKFKWYVSKVTELVDQLSNIWSAYNDKRKAEDDAYLARVEENSEKQKTTLKQRLDFGLISETEYTNRLKKNEQRLEMEKKRIARDQAIREKRARIFETVINTIAGAVEALPNYILAALIGVTGAASVAAISAEPIPQFAGGARVNKPTIAMVGEKGKEIVLSNKVVDSPVYGPFADDLARIQEGRQPRFIGQPSVPNYSGMNKAIASTNITNNTVVNQVDTEGMASMTKEIKAMAKEISKLKYLQAVISDKELTERDKDKELLLRYSKF